MGVHNKDSKEIQTQEFLEHNPIFAAFGQSLFVLWEIYASYVKLQHLTPMEQSECDTTTLVWSKA